jgi:NADH dehydrogenase FAD-containing subunit
MHIFNPRASTAVLHIRDIPTRNPLSRNFSYSAGRSKERLVILGSGWGGYEVLRGVDKKRWGQYYREIWIRLLFNDSTSFSEVTMLSPNNYFNFTPLLAGCAVGTLEFRCAVEPVSTEAVQL